VYYFLKICVRFIEGFEANGLIKEFTAKGWNKTIDFSALTLLVGHQEEHPVC